MPHKSQLYLMDLTVQGTGRFSSLHGNASLELNNNLRCALKFSRHSMHHGPIVLVVNWISRTTISASERDLRRGTCISRDRDRDTLNISPRLDIPLRN